MEQPAASTSRDSITQSGAVTNDSGAQITRWRSDYSCTHQAPPSPCTPTRTVLPIPASQREEMTVSSLHRRGNTPQIQTCQTTVSAVYENEGPPIVGMSALDEEDLRTPKGIHIPMVEPRRSSVIARNSIGSRLCGRQSLFHSRRASDSSVANKDLLLQVLGRYRPSMKSINIVSNESLNEDWEAFVEEKDKKVSKLKSPRLRVSIKTPESVEDNSFSFQQEFLNYLENKKQKHSEDSKKKSKDVEFKKRDKKTFSPKRRGASVSSNPEIKTSLQLLPPLEVESKEPYLKPHRSKGYPLDRYVNMHINQEGKVDALSIMHAGTQFLKYGAYGFPHFRHFHLTGDNQAIQWYSKKKNPKRTRVQLRDITEIVLGDRATRYRNTRRKQADLPQELKNNSFTIVYDNNKTLDLIAIHSKEFQVWMLGMTQLLGTVRQMGWKALGAVNHIFLTRSKEGKRKLFRPSMLDSENSTKDKVYPKSISKLVEGFIDETKSTYASKEVKTSAEVCAELEKLDKKVEFLAKKLEGTNKAFKDKSSSYKAVGTTIASIKESLKKIKGHHSRGNLKQCRAGIWRVGVSIESLEHMISAMPNI